MDESSQVFSHQIGIVNELAKYFEKVTVLTGKAGTYKVLPNVEVFTSNWIPGKRIISSLKVVSLFLKLLYHKRFNLVFSHMTSIQSALVSPVTKMLRIKHYLWYTHTSDNLALRVAHKLTNGVLTATAGSCPITGKKIHVVGHSIDIYMFKKKIKVDFPISKFIHVGRFDASKNIELMINALKGFREGGQDITFVNIGSPSGENNDGYYKKIIENSNAGVDKVWLDFKTAIPRNLLSEVMQKQDALIHAFEGSLDKAVLEATFMGLPVVTINPEYLKIFGSWNLEDKSKNHGLSEELKHLFSLSEVELQKEVDRRYELAKQDYELVGWGVRVSKILKS
jgi:glycosyltransferase involved in cell wall biosynthesis